MVKLCVLVSQVNNLGSEFCASGIDMANRSSCPLFYIVPPFVVLAVLPFAAFGYEPWPIGVEREVDEGVYMSVRSVREGWRVWRIETKSGHDCMAIKSAKNRSHPIPLGSGSLMYGGTPFLMVSYGSRKPNRILYRWRTRHYGGVTVKVRRDGEKFWDEYRAWTVDMEKYGEESVNVVLESWEYPEIHVGFAKETARFELLGINWALSAVRECNS